MSNDPFAKAKAIRKGELDNEIPDYEVMTGWLQRVSISWLPGLMIYVIQQCVIRGVFKDREAMLRVVSSAIDVGEDEHRALRQPDHRTT